MKRMVAFLVIIAIFCTMFSACRPKYKYYKNTHIPKLKNVCEIEPEDRFDPDPYFSDFGRQFIGSLGYKFDEYGYIGVREAEIQEYYRLLIEEGYSQSFEKSFDNLICFAKNSEIGFQIVVIISDFNEDGDEITIILVSEHESRMFDEDFEAFLGY